MSTEWGALAGVFPVDDIVIEWLLRRIEFVGRRGRTGVASETNGNGRHPRLNLKRMEELTKNRPKADPDASYAKTLTLNLDSVQPYVSAPTQSKL